MNTFKLTRRVSLILLSGAVLALHSVALQAQTQTPATPQTPKPETHSTIKWEWNDDGWRRRVAINGKAEFTDDYSDVSGVTEGSSVRIEEELGGNLRRLEVRRDENGALVRTYSLNGQTRAMDDDARKWVAGLLLMAVRNGAIDVDNRVKRLMRQRGVNGTLEEIKSLSSGHTQRVYFQALITTEGISRADLARVIAAAGAELSSDHEKANLLKKTAHLFLGDSTSRDSFFQAVATINSDYEHRGTLSALLKRKDLSAAVLSKMLESASGIESDHEKANFLLEASELYAGDSQLRGAFLKTVETIKSDHERGRVLNALLRNKQIG